jgi:hypothetical protein
MRRAADEDKPEPPDDDLLEHKDAIVLAHKSLRSAIAFHREGLQHLSRAADLVGSVCDAMDTGDGGEPDEAHPLDEQRAVQLRRAASIRRRFGAL